MINTRFWIDDYIANLDPIEKLLFLYFLTNPATDICGIYELPLKNIALDTGIDKEMVVKMLERFSKDGKIFYKNGWVAIKNFAKHQAMNPKVQKGIEIGLSKAPKEILDSLSIAYDSLSHSNSNLNSNLNSNSNRELTPAQESKLFFEGDTESIFSEFLEKTKAPHDLLEKEFQKFTLYWTEPTSTGLKQRWQTEKTFEVRRRLANWLSRVKDFQKVEFSKGRGIA